MTSGRIGTNHADVVAEDLLLAPLLEGLVHAEGIAEVHGAREVLLGAVIAVRGEQFFGAQHRKRFEQLGPDLVLATFATRRGNQRGAKAVAVSVKRQHGVVLVVRMRGRHHEIADRIQLAEHQRQRRLAALGSNGEEPVLRQRRGDDEDGDGEGEKSRSTHPNSVPQGRRCAAAGHRPGAVHECRSLRSRRRASAAAFAPRIVTLR